MANKVTFNEIKNTIRNTLSKYLFAQTERNPMIIPVIMNLN
jgi:mRNA degradation ribonuclease J1/J2